jgi:HEAT repeat protein
MKLQTGSPNSFDKLVRWLSYLSPKKKRWLAARLLRGYGEPAVEPLCRVLKDPDNNVRKAAAESLGHIGDARAVEPLVGALRAIDDGVRKAAAEALGKIGDARAVPSLLDALNNDWHAALRLAAAQALGELKDARAVPPLIERLKDKDAEVRKSAAEALGKIQDPQTVSEATAALCVALSDKSSRVRLAAAEALGRILKDSGDERAIQPLLKALRACFVKGSARWHLVMGLMVTMAFLLLFAGLIGGSVALKTWGMIQSLLYLFHWIGSYYELNFCVLGKTPPMRGKLFPSSSA